MRLSHYLSIGIVIFLGCHSQQPAPLPEPVPTREAVAPTVVTRPTVTGFIYPTATPLSSKGLLREENTYRQYISKSLRDFRDINTDVGNALVEFQRIADTETKLAAEKSLAQSRAKISAIEQDLSSIDAPPRFTRLHDLYGRYLSEQELYYAAALENLQSGNPDISDSMRHHGDNSRQLQREIDREMNFQGLR